MPTKYPVQGAGHKHVLLLGESETENAHWMLDRLLKRLGLERDQFYLTTVEHPALNKFIQDHGVKVVVPLGEVALAALLGETDVMRWRGRPVEHQLPGVVILPTLQPSKLLARRAEEEEDDEGNIRKKKVLRNPPRFQGTFMRDLRVALQVAKDGFAREKPYYQGDVSIMEWNRYVQAFKEALAKDPTLWLSFDIETPYKLKTKDEGEIEESERAKDGTILRISFSYRPGTGISVPWEPLYMEGIRELLGSEARKVVWNGITFDCPLIEGQGVTVGGRVYDFMDGWHLFQSDLPKGLEFVTSYYTDIRPWKHLSGSDPVLYSAIDADAALRNALGIEADLRACGMWETFERLVVDLAPVLYRAGRRGNVIDREKQERLKKDLSEKLRIALLDAQAMVPDYMTKRKFYVRKGKEGAWGSTVQQVKVRMCSRCGKLNINKRHACKDGPDWELMRTTVAKEVFFKELPPRDASLDDIRKWLKDNGFNPNSSEQMKAYMKAHKHPVGKDKKDKDKETADTKHLKKLAGKYGDKHPIYGHTVMIHQLTKALSTYVEGFAPDENGLVYSTYVNSPSTWRLGCRDVNMHSMAKREGNPYAKEARKTIVARKGNVLVNADSSSIEAVFVGHFMGDPHYIELAKRGIHAWLMCQRLKEPFTPENVDRLKKEKKALYDMYKVTNHMTNYGGTHYTLYETYPDTFGSLKNAKECQQFLFTMLPKLKQWQHQERVRAHKETFLTSPWGFRHYFYDVFTYKHDEDGNLIYGPDGLPKVKLGKDSKRCVAFRPQNSAGCFMRENLVILDRDYHLGEFMGANVSVHDGYCLDVPTPLENEVVEILATVLTRPIPQMDGLRVGCEVEVGENWSEMERVKRVVV